jgi:hypothetical protein
MNMTQTQITYTAERGIDGTGIVIAECGDASALWDVVEECYSPEDTDECPIEDDGCWPVPPADVIAEAKRMAD